MPRANPPEPPRFGCVTMLILPSPRASTRAKSGWSRTACVPWSTTTTRSTRSIVSAEETSDCSSKTQSAGRLKVVMATVTRPTATRSDSTIHSAHSTVDSSCPPDTSNQYHPPSPKGARVRSKLR